MRIGSVTRATAWKYNFAIEFKMKFGGFVKYEKMQKMQQESRIHRLRASLLHRMLRENLRLVGGLKNGKDQHIGTRKRQAH